MVAISLLFSSLLLATQQMAHVCQPKLFLNQPPHNPSFLEAFKRSCPGQEHIQSALLKTPPSNLQPPSLSEGFPAMFFQISDKSTLISKLQFVLIGKFSHGRPAWTVIQKFFLILNLKGSINVSYFDHKHIYIECSNLEDYNRIWLNLVWKIDGYAMRVFRWTPEFSSLIESPIAPLWIRLENLPLHLFDEMSLWNLANVIGRPLRIDSRNLNRSMLNSARVCVEVDVSKPLIDKFKTCFDDDKGAIVEESWVHVFYEQVPPFCHSCLHINHSMDMCKRNNEHRRNEQQRNDANTNLTKPYVRSSKVWTVVHKSATTDSTKGKKTVDSGLVRTMLDGQSSNKATSESGLQSTEQVPRAIAGVTAQVFDKGPAPIDAEPAEITDPEAAVIGEEEQIHTSIQEETFVTTESADQAAAVSPIVVQNVDSRECHTPALQHKKKLVKQTISVKENSGKHNSYQRNTSVPATIIVVEKADQIEADPHFPAEATREGDVNGKNEALKLTWAEQTETEEIGHKQAESRVKLLNDIDTETERIKMVPNHLLKVQTEAALQHQGSIMRVYKNTLSFYIPDFYTQASKQQEYVADLLLALFYKKQINRAIEEEIKKDIAKEEQDPHSEQDWQIVSSKKKRGAKHNNIQKKDPLIWNSETKQATENDKVINKDKRAHNTKLTQDVDVRMASLCARINKMRRDSPAKRKLQAELKVLSRTLG